MVTEREAWDYRGVLVVHRGVPADADRCVAIVRGLPEYFTTDVGGKVAGLMGTHPAWVVMDGCDVVGFAIVEHRSAAAADMWSTLRGTSGIFAFRLYLLAQATDLAERMIGADPDLFFGHFLDSWTRVPDAIPDDIRTAYLTAARSRDAIRAICGDYRASAYVDNDHDEADRRAGRRLSMPVAALWQDPGETVLPFDPASIWAG